MTCSFCFEECFPCETITQLACTHYFHAVCFAPWKGSCPTCRGPRLVVDDGYVRVPCRVVRVCSARAENIMAAAIVGGGIAAAATGFDDLTVVLWLLMALVALTIPRKFVRSNTGKFMGFVDDDAPDDGFVMVQGRRDGFVMVQGWRDD